MSAGQLSGTPVTTELAVDKQSVWPEKGPKHHYFLDLRSVSEHYVK